VAKRSSRRTNRRISRRTLAVRAPRKGTLIVATILYLAGVLGAYDLVPTLKPFATLSLTIAGGLLILGAIMRDL
jgi:hypothetical protein